MKNLHKRIRQSLRQSNLPDDIKSRMVEDIEVTSNDRHSVNHVASLEALRFGNLNVISRYLVRDGSDDNYFKNFEDNVIPYIEEIHRG